MNFKDYMVSKGLSEEQATTIIEGMGNEKLYISHEERIDERYAKLKSQKEELESQLNANQEELNTLKESAKGNDELTKQLADLQEKFDEAKENSNKALSAKEKEFAIKLAIKEAKALDDDIVLSQLDLDTIKVVEGKLQGFEEQLKGLKEGKAFLFKDDVEPNKPHIVTAGNPNGGNPTKVTREDFDKMTLAEKAELQKNNPDSFREITGGH